MAIASDVSYLISMLCELGNLIFLEKLHLISFLCTIVHLIPVETELDALQTYVFIVIEILVMMA